jgi:hypothetical protein
MGRYLVAYIRAVLTRESMVEVPDLTELSESGVRAAVLAHPWSLMGIPTRDKPNSRGMYVRPRRAVSLRCVFSNSSNVELFVEQGFIVAAFNARGAGSSGGSSTASVATQTKDYESVVEQVMKCAQDASVRISQLYICGYCTSLAD